MTKHEERAISFTSLPGMANYSASQFLAIKSIHDSELWETHQLIEHAIYVLRTFFGLYSMLHQLKAEVRLNYTLD